MAHTMDVHGMDSLEMKYTSKSWKPSFLQVNHGSHCLVFLWSLPDVDSQICRLPDSLLFFSVQVAFVVAFFHCFASAHLWGPMGIVGCNVFCVGAGTNVIHTQVTECFDCV